MSERKPKQVTLSPKLNTFPLYDLSVAFVLILDRETIASDSSFWRITYRIDPQAVRDVEKETRGKEGGGSS